MHSQRQILIKDLNEKAAFLRLNLTIVFDARDSVEGTRRTHLSEIEIIYTSGGESADDYIIRHLERVNDASKYTVITCDGELRKRSKNQGAQVQSLDEFANFICTREDNALQRMPKRLQSDEVSLETSEMQRWLKVFEKLLKQKDG